MVLLLDCFQVFPYLRAHCLSSLLPRPRKNKILRKEIHLLESSTVSTETTRRNLLLGALCTAGGGVSWLYQSESAHALDLSQNRNELPMVLRDFTKLAPLGKVEGSVVEKSRNLPLQELAKRLEHDLLYGSTGQRGGGYILSGDFSEDIFRDDCVFVDPNNRVASLSQCKKALEVLFDPQKSHIQLLHPLEVNEADRTIRGKFRVRGFLQFPWRPYITAYESIIVYTIDEEGLVAEQRQMWTKSAVKALQESFTPTINTPPPLSTIPEPSNEPKEVSTLFGMVDGRRPGEYSEEEQFEIISLIQKLRERHDEYKSKISLGEWRVAFVQEGPGGIGIDRRIPFPEFPFNDNYQIATATTDEIVNVSELFGPLLFVKVFGKLRELDSSSQIMPKRFDATVSGGGLCWGGERHGYEGGFCLDLPMIQGTGQQDFLFNSERIRILRSVDGGGTIVVQIRIV